MNITQVQSILLLGPQTKDTLVHLLYNGDGVEDALITVCYTLLSYLFLVSQSIIVLVKFIYIFISSHYAF